MAVVFAFVFCGCKAKKSASEQTPDFNPFVEAFTGGTISRHAPVYLVFNRDIPADRLDDAAIRKHIKIRPAVEGEFSTLNDHTIVFRPRNGFRRNTAYEVTADLSQWFGEARGDERNFRFGFTTLPFAVRGNLSSLDINKDNPDTYDIVGSFVTADRETPEEITSAIVLSERVEAVWQHSPDGRRHEVTLRGVIPVAESRRLTFTDKNSKEEILSVTIPSNEDFSVKSVELRNEPERRIEVTFTRLLDASQSLRGLASIEGNRSEVVGVEGNKIFLYPDAGRTGGITVLVDAAIRSHDGRTLGENSFHRVDLGENAPKASFIGRGTIMPLSDRLHVPFQAIYLRGVVVRVLKITERNIGQFLQTNRLDGSDDLMRVGRLVARRTVFLDDDPNVDLTRLNTFAIDLRELMQPEPGAIYRVELSINRQLSVYPCDDGNFRRLSRAEIEAQDAVLLREEAGRFDDGGYYYTGFFDHFDWSNYDYRQRNNPCHDTYYYGKNDARNVMASDLGLIAMAGDGDGFTVLVHNITTTRPERGVEVRLYNFQHQLLGEGRTDEHGYTFVRADAGRPFYIVAAQGAQRGYLRVDNGSALSLSTFDVSGEVVQRGIRGFIYGERGVWRPGDTMHLSFMLSDQHGTLPADHPVVMELYNPLGQLVRSQTRTRGELGLYTFTLATDSEAPTGAWRVEVRVGGATFSRRVRVETIKPNRLKIDFRLEDKMLVRDVASPVKLHAEWLQGAVAHNLRYEVSGTFSSIPTRFDRFADYVFDDPTKSFEAEETTIVSGRLNDTGNASFDLRLSSSGPSPGMLQANLVTRVFEESGDFSIDAFTVPYSPYRRYVGISSPQTDREQLNTGVRHVFRTVAVDPHGRPQADVLLRVEVFRVNWYYWWSSNASNLANFRSDSHNAPVRNLTVRSGATGATTFDLQFPNQEWGTYFIRVSDVTGGHSTGLLAYFDWPGGARRTEGDASAATLLNFKTDKESYRPGEKVTVTIPSTLGSRAIVAVQNGSRVLSVKAVECHDRQTTITVDVTPEMQPNAYLYITLLQPHTQTLNDMPIRLYGVVPVIVTSDESRLHPVIAVRDEIRPESTYEITVSEQSGREMAYTLAVVDEGLLDLTRFRTPDPWRAFNAREALGVNTWDLYNHIVGAYGGRIEQLFSIGGDDNLAGGARAVVNRFRPVVQFEGPFLLGKGRTMRHRLEMPNYNGRVRVMVVAGDGRAYGNAERSVMVRQPVMVLGTLPRVIGVGEEMSVPATVFATEDNIGTVRVSISCSDNMEIIGPAEQTLNFTRKEDRQVPFRIRVKDRAGVGSVTITATAKGERSTYQTDIEIRSVRLPQTRVVNATVNAGENWNRNISMPGADGTNRLTLEVSNVEPLNLAKRLDFLLGYPHGCIEQITSRAFPQVFLSGLASLTREQSQMAEEAVKEVIRRLRSYQTVDGGMSYWPGGTSVDAWSSVYAAHFLCEAEARGYMIPDAMKRSLMEHLRRTARGWRPVTGVYGRSEELTQAYRLYVLALDCSSELGAMNRMKESRELSFQSRWMLALAYAKVGRRDVAEELTRVVTDVTGGGRFDEHDLTFGSELRNRAVMLMTLCALDRAPEAAEQARVIARTLSSDDWLSTQSTAYGLLAMSEYMKKYPPSGRLEFSYSSTGKKDNVSTDKSLWSMQLLDRHGNSAPVEVKNNTNGVLFVRVITEGIPNQGTEEAYANGIALSVAYLDQRGNPIDVAALGQGVNFSAVVTLRNPSAAAYRNIALTQIFPAGWEILNTRFTNEDATDRYPAGVSFQDIRDDRVLSYIDHFPAGRQITVRIDLCTVYPGIFYLPPVGVEAMYDNTVRANTEGKNVRVEGK